MSVYLIELLSTGGQTKIVDQVVVSAPSEATAREICKRLYRADGGPAVWDAATVTSLESRDEWGGYTFTITVSEGATTHTAEYVAADEDTTDDVGEALVTALNATDIDGADYDDTTKTLTIVETTDAMGDWDIEVSVTPPAGALAGMEEALTAVTGFFTDLTAAGADSIARTTVLNPAAPEVFGKGLKVY